MEMKMLKKIFFIILFGFLIFIPSISGAQTVNVTTNSQTVNVINSSQTVSSCKSNCPSGATCLCNPLSVTTPQSLLGNIINYVLGIVGSIALIMFIYGGFTWLTSAGSSENIKKGRDIIVWATIGLVVIFLSYGLVKFLILNIQ